MNDGLITKKDTLLRLIYLYKEMSSEGINLIEGGFYIERLKGELVKEGYVKRANLKTASKSAKRAGVSFRTQTYYVTAKGKKRLAKLFPDEFSEESMPLRKYNNDVTERLVKLSDTIVIAETSGIHVVNRDSALDVSKMDSLTSEESGQADDEYYDSELDAVLELSENSTEVNSESDEVDVREALKDIVKDNLDSGLMFTADEVKRTIVLSDKEVRQYNFTSITGVLLTKEKPYCLYHAGNGYLPQSMKGEGRIATTLLLTYAAEYGLYADELRKARISNAIIYFKNISAFSKLVLNKYSSKVSPGNAFDNAYLIPVSRNGCNILRKFSTKPSYKYDLINYLVDEHDYTRRIGFAMKSLPLENPDGEAVFVGIDFSVNDFRFIIQLLDSDKEDIDSVEILCYSWQQDYYEDVINLLNIDKITCQLIDEELLDEVLGYEGRIPTVKERPRRKPTYLNNTLFKGRKES